MGAWKVIVRDSHREMQFVDGLTSLMLSVAKNYNIANTTNFTIVEVANCDQYHQLSTSLAFT